MNRRPGSLEIVFNSGFPFWRQMDPHWKAGLIETCSVHCLTSRRSPVADRVRFSVAVACNALFGGSCQCLAMGQAFMCVQQKRQVATNQVAEQSSVVVGECHAFF